MDESYSDMVDPDQIRSTEGECVTSPDIPMTGSISQ